MISNGIGQGCGNAIRALRIMLPKLLPGMGTSRRVGRREVALAVLVGGGLWSAVGALPCFAEDWARFRGVNGSGISTDPESLPDSWSPTENLKWKVALPGPGSSSPIVVGDKVFVTCWSGYGLSRGEEAGDQSQLMRHLLCLDRETGATIWDKEVKPFLPEDDYGGMFAEHGYASHSPVSDGERVYVYFGKTGALAFDMQGNQLWQTSVGTESDPRGWGSSSSPVLYKDLLIVTATAESEAIVALDKRTGKEVWRQEAQGFGGTWGTPVLVEVSADRTDLVIGVPFEIWGLNPETGKLRWYCDAMDTNSYCSSVVTGDGVVYGIEGRGGGSIAVKAGGEGDVTGTHVVWTGRDNNRIGTPVLQDERPYFFSGGVANCIDAKSGKQVYQSRLVGTPGAAGAALAENRGPPQGAQERPEDGPPRGPEGRGQGGRGPEGRGQGGGGGFGGRRGGRMGSQDYSSAVSGDGKLYFISRGGDGYVLKIGPEFHQLSVNRVTADAEDFSATPAISHGCLFIRSSKHVYCIGADSKKGTL